MATVAEQPSGVPIPIPTPPSPSPSLPSSTPTTSTSPSFPFPRPRSPTKGELPHLQRATTDIKPNAHPYPIKTTSTALLSRSNSVSASPATKHHYVPLPPSPSPSHSSSYSGTGAAGAKDKRTTEYRGHRYSRSLSSSEDMYLPHSHHAASSSGGDANGNINGNASASPQGPRALPIPPGVSNNSIASMNMAANKNTNANGTSPKRWTPAQLAAHLDRTISREAGEWAARRGVGGRAFMRMAEDEMAAMGAPAPATLRPAARALRQEVLQSQLDVSSSPVSSGSESPTRRILNASPTRGLNASPTRGLNASPMRIDEGEEDVFGVGGGAEGEAEDDDDTPSRRGARTHATPHIRASAAPWASRGDNATSPSPFTSADSPRNGRVRGMVRTLESSGSEGGSGSEWDGSPERGGSGFRRVRVGSNANGNGNGNGNGGAGGEIRNGHGNGSGFRQQHANGSQVSVGSQSQSGGEESDGVGGTMRPQRSLPARPDGVEVGMVDLGGATVRAGGEGNGNGNGTTTAPGEDELTVEELLALEPQGTGTGSWRRSPRRSGHGHGHGRGHKHEQNTITAEGLVSQHSTGGRPLPPQPPRAGRSSSGGVHAWEADEGLVGSTVKRVPASTPTHAHAAVPFEVPGRVVVAPPASSASAAQSHAERKALEEEAAARGRERGRAVRAQVAEAKREGAVLRDIVEEFRARLEEVERKVGAMEVAAASGSTAPASTATPAGVPPPSSTLTRLDPRRLLAAFFGSASAQDGAGNGNGDVKTRGKGRGAENDFMGPTTIRALPSYVLLVGLGVCAVVLRVLVRRGFGAVRRRP
ncbi:hypothetical protein B0H11DRAFT_672426 [Mycena galericulata]|nr:hypothetical protein B0H11DRAFT_672426 [Mycena galericulata]